MFPPFYTIANNEIKIFPHFIRNLFFIPKQNISDKIPMSINF